MLHEGNALIHAGILVGIAILIYHFFVQGNFSGGNAPVDNGLAGYPSTDAY